MPPTRKLTLTQLPTLIAGDQFSSGAIAWLPPTLKIKLTLTVTLTPTLRWGGSNCPDTRVQAGTLVKEPKAVFSKILKVH